jgi:hypothetical protein
MHKPLPPAGFSCARCRDTSRSHASGAAGVRSASRRQQHILFDCHEHRNMSPQPSTCSLSSRTMRCDQRIAFPAQRTSCFVRVLRHRCCAHVRELLGHEGPRTFRTAEDLGVMSEAAILTIHRRRAFNRQTFTIVSRESHWSIAINISNDDAAQIECVRASYRSIDSTASLLREFQADQRGRDRRVAKSDQRGIQCRDFCLRARSSPALHTARMRYRRGAAAGAAAGRAAAAVTAAAEGSGFTTPGTRLRVYPPPGTPR